VGRDIFFKSQASVSKFSREGINIEETPTITINSAAPKGIFEKKSSRSSFE
jgi:hypothetical protein